MVGLLTFLVVAAGLFGRVAVARAEAQTAADLAALAGVQAVLDGTGEGCAVARRVAARNGSRLALCTSEGRERLRVRAERPLTGSEAGRWALPAGWSARAEALAGPDPTWVPRRGAGAVAWARAQAGKPYLWGGTGPDAFDCSGLTSQALLHGAGITIPRVAQDQYDAATKVAYDDLRPGDLIFYGSSERDVTHVVMYTGDGMIVEAPRRGSVVSERPIRFTNAMPWAGRF